MAKMIGGAGHPFCGRKCCGTPGKAHKRRMKRSERNKWKREVK